MSSKAYTVSKMLESINDIMLPVTSASVSLKRKLDNGVMLDTSPREVALLDLQAKVKHAAQEVASIQASGGDRNGWMREKRELANKAFRNGFFDQAAEMYVEALAGLDFGTTPEQRLVCERVEQLPLTCNLAACLLMTEQWEKARKVCDEALRLDPSCIRALIQRAKAMTKLTRFDEARRDLEHATHSFKGKESHPDGENISLEKLSRQLNDITRAERRERMRVVQQRKFEKQMMREAVGRLYEDKDNIVERNPEYATRYMQLESNLTSLKERLVRCLASIVLAILQFFFGSIEKHQ